MASMSAITANSFMFTYRLGKPPRHNRHFGLNQQLPPRGKKNRIQAPEESPRTRQEAGGGSTTAGKATPGGWWPWGGFMPRGEECASMNQAFRWLPDTFGKLHRCGEPTRAQDL
jgi:hypothetical protein